MTLAMLAATLVGPGAVSGAQGAQARMAEASSSVGVAQAKTKPKPKPYTPARGVKFNNPLSKDRKRIIINHIIKSIDSTPKRQWIRILSWNIRSNAFYDSLIRAHRRGVAVRVLISYGNANPELPNKGFNRLQRELKVGNAKRKPALRSWAKKCRSSCRGTRGIAHSKVYLFSKVGDADGVVMYSSANATDIAAGYQWNDIYTLHSRPLVYQDFIGVFKELAADKRRKDAFRMYDRGNFRSEFLPIYGHKGDPVLDELAKVRCKGATGRAGNAKGRTVIRIAQTATLAKRGHSIATRVKELWDKGCDVKIVYAVMGNEVLRIYRQKSGRGPVPIQQIAQDWNFDGVYDRYLHMKAMTISGVYGKQTDAEVVFNGSQNWSGLALISDEAGGRILKRKTRVKYSTWIEWLFNNPPPGAPPMGRTTALGRTTGPQIAPSLPTSVKHGGIEM